MPDKEEVFIELLDITPQQAINWLDAVPDYQRKVDQNRVQAIAFAIRKGEWRENGATIVFNSNGDLIDGQHRLHAISISGKTIRSIVVTGVNKDQTTFDTLGDVKARKVTDFLYCKRSSLISGAIRYQWQINNKNPNWMGSRDGGGHTVGFYPPVVDLVRLARRSLPDIEPIAVELDSARTLKVVNQGSFALFLAYYFSQRAVKREMEIVSRYFARIGDGIDLKKYDPAYMIRKRFLELRSTEMVPRYVAKGLILKGLNVALEGKEIDRLTFIPDREPFPALRGYDAVPVVKADSAKA